MPTLTRHLEPATGVGRNDRVAPKVMTPEVRKAAKRLLAHFPKSIQTDYETLFNNTKTTLMTDYGLDELIATKLANQAVEDVKSADSNAVAHYQFLHGLLTEST